MSSISIIGLGNMASVLAARAFAGGTVEVIGRDAAKAKDLAAAAGTGRRPGISGPAPRPIFVCSAGRAGRAGRSLAGGGGGVVFSRASGCARWMPAAWRWRTGWKGRAC